MATDYGKITVIENVLSFQWGDSFLQRTYPSAEDAAHEFFRLQKAVRAQMAGIRLSEVE